VSSRLILAIAAVSLAVVGGFLWLTHKPSGPSERPHTSRAASHKPGVPAPSTAAAEPPAAITPPKRPRAPSADASVPADVATAPSAPATATLHVTSDVDGAQVFLDRKFIGAAPATIPDVPPGPHRLNVSAAGYDGYADSIDVTAGSREIAVRFKEVTLDAHIDVVHKHSFGSCKGRLSATPDGLTYATSNASDTFASPLLDLTGFDVNYLAKTLTVKLKGGKSFTFTDPDGNADHLFVFQRDVSKVRDRLRKGE